MAAIHDGYVRPFMEQPPLPRIDPDRRTIRTLWFLVPVLTLLACALSIWHNFQTRLPAHRPPDFMLQDQGINWLAQQEYTFTVSAAVCEYRTSWTWHRRGLSLPVNS